MVWYIHSVYYTLYSKISLKNFFQHFFQRNGPGPLNVTFGSDIPITVLHLMLMSKICVVNSYMKNVIGISDPSECDVQRTRSPGPLVKIKCDHNLMKCNWKKKKLFYFLCSRHYICTAKSHQGLWEQFFSISFATTNVIEDFQ